MDLFDKCDAVPASGELANYPDRPGYQRTDTSKAAADDMIPFAPTIKELVISALEERGPLATFELATYLRRSYRSVQPRTSELRAEQKIFDCGKRRTDPDTGKDAIVWAIIPQGKDEE